MPTTATSLSQAVEDVKNALGLLDDGVADPLLDQQIIGAINAAQRQLETEHRWLRKRRALSMPWNGGQRYHDLPAEALVGTLEALVFVMADGTRCDLVSGIPPRSEDISGVPQRYDITPTLGITAVDVIDPGTGYTTGASVAITGGLRDDDGADPVFQVTAAGGLITSVEPTDTGAAWVDAPTLTVAGGSSAVLLAIVGPVQVLELFPTPDGGTLTMEYQAGAVRLVDDADLLALDAEAVVGRAAWLVATSPTRRLPNSDALLAVHNSYLKAAQNRQRPGQSLSLRRSF